MAKSCEICGRGPMSSNARSHSNIATKRKQHLNLQKVRHQGRRANACTKCIKADRVK